MLVHAIPINEALPADAILVDGEFWLESGQRIKLYKLEPVSEQARQLEQEIEATRTTCIALAKELEIESEVEEQRQVQELIDKLHAYNETKDVAQALLGRLALLEGCTTREIYPRFDLELED